MTKGGMTNGGCAGCVNRCCCPSAVMVDLTVAAADADMASTINSSLIQSVQNSTAFATCLGVSLPVLSVHDCVQAYKLLYITKVTKVALDTRSCASCMLSNAC